jgi:DNA primase
VKEAVRIEQVANEYGEFRLAGSGRLLGRCVSPDHEDKTPSLTIDTEQQRFRCYGIGCGARGDVFDLVMLAEGCELLEAMMILSTGHDVERPGRSESWYRRQERQKPVRDAIHAARFDHLRRRLFRRFFKDSVLAIEDEEEREAEYRILWEATEPLAEMLIRDLQDRGLA